MGALENNAGGRSAMEVDISRQHSYRESPERVPARPFLDDVDNLLDMLPLSASDVELCGMGMPIKMEEMDTYGVPTTSGADNGCPPFDADLTCLDVVPLSVSEPLSGGSSPMSDHSTISEFPPSPDVFGPFVVGVPDDDTLLKLESLITPEDVKPVMAVDRRPASRLSPPSRRASVTTQPTAANRPAKRAKCSGRERSPSPDLDDIPTFDETGLSKDEIKKRRRMLKNRQSASLSRKRKKEYLESLEEQISGLNDTIDAQKRVVAQRDREGEALKARLLRSDAPRLRAENEKFKARVAELEAENAALRQRLEHGDASGMGQIPSFKTGSMLMACLFCFALISRPISPPDHKGASLAMAPPHFHYGRTLKAVPGLVPSAQTALLESPARRRPTPTRLEPSFNHAESTKELAAPRPPGMQETTRSGGGEIQETTRSGGGDGDLDKWLAAHEARLVSQLNDTASELSGTELAHPDPNGRVPEVPPTFKLDGGYHASMINTVRRRTDTSYVFCSEVQILSALAASGQQNPKVSLIVPTRNAQNGNGTNQPASLLQINCDVTNTELLRTQSSETNVTVG